jgi:hypothetical protein
MMRIHSRGRTISIALLIVALGAAAAQAASACRDIDYATQRAKLQRFLASHDFSQGEQAFLVKGADRRVREMLQGRLNARGAACGIKAVRAHVLGCLNSTLPSTFKSVPSPNRKTGKTLWGKVNVAAREAAVIGAFHTCRGAAMETFLSVE